MHVGILKSLGCEMCRDGRSWLSSASCKTPCGLMDLMGFTVKVVFCVSYLITSLSQTK
jgi:hypothetical protein